MSIDRASKAYQDAEDFTRSTMEGIRVDLEADAVRHVEHYLYHNECEMAFEGLFLDIMKSDLGGKVDLARSLEIAKSLELDRESVYDVHFWSNLSLYARESEIGYPVDLARKLSLVNPALEASYQEHIEDSPPLLCPFLADVARFLMASPHDKSVREILDHLETEYECGDELVRTLIHTCLLEPLFFDGLTKEGRDAYTMIYSSSGNNLRAQLDVIAKFEASRGNV